MTISGEEFLNIAWHGNATSAFGVVPVKFHAGKFDTLPVLSDGVVLIEDVAEVKGMAFTNVFNAEVIDNEGEYDMSPLVNPEARCGGSLLVDRFMKACCKEVVGELASLGKAVDTFRISK